MTQIKLRRDTSANFTSANPVLGQGEPAYETDTKKLKIGDGTTAYTQLEYFSTGGGGSTNISATLPLKIVDGVISLEVDGQTIQIVDGKLHANLDELGNEVNNLSGRVAAAEADILTKENKITATGALSLQEKIKSNAVGFTITSESAMTNDHYQRVPFPESQNSRLYIQDSSFTYPYKSYLAIPYSLGQVIRVPRAYGQLFFGSFDDSGDFIVSVGFNTFYYGTDGFALFGGPVYRDAAGTTEYPPVMPKLNPTQMGYNGNYTYHTPPREAADSGNLYSLSDYLPENDFSCAFYQISPDTTGAIMIQAFWSITTGRCSTAVYRDTETNYQYAGHLDAMRNNIQYALWLPNETGTSYNPSKFGLYDWNVSRIPWSNESGWEAFFKGRGANLYSLTGQSSKNYLELNLGDGLSVVDGKLVNTNPTAYSLPTASSSVVGGIKVGDNSSITADGTLSATGGGSAPTNMVTTDTAQTISGDKEFTGITTMSNDIKIPIGKKITTPDGQWLMRFWTGFIGLGTSVCPLTTYDGSNYYLHNKSIIAGDGIEITEPSIGEIKISSTSGNMAAYITETYVNGTSGYNVYSNGYCEQWGSGNFPDEGNITFIKRWKDVNYNLQGEMWGIDSTGNLGIREQYETYAFCNLVGDRGGKISWKASGYLAEGEY